MKHITQLKTGFRIGIFVLFLLLLNISVFAVVKPARGYLKMSDGSPLAGESVFVLVKVHSDTDYPCFCNTFEVFTSDEGEFVSDFANLYYLGDCDFWQKKEGDACYNDWTEGDLVLVRANGELREVNTIDKSPIHELGYLTYVGEQQPVGPSTEPLDIIKNELRSAYTGLEFEQKAEKDGLEIKDIRIEIIDDSYYIVSDIANPTDEDFSDLLLKVVTKDIDGQVYDLFENPIAELLSNSTKRVSVKWETDRNAGLYYISSILYDQAEVIAVSKEIQVIVDRVEEREKYVILEKPGKINYVPYLNIFLLIIILILVVILYFDFVIMRRQKELTGEKEKEGKSGK